VIADRLMALAVRTLPPSVREWFRAQQRRHRLQWPRTGSVTFGELDRLTPVSRVFGLDRGLPIDRYFIEQFLAAHASDIRGRVLEIGDNRYTRQFGGTRVSASDVLHLVAGSRGATIIGDLTAADHIPAETFDCIVATQTLQMIYDVGAALRHIARILKPGGVLLATSHGISRIARREGVDDWGEYWHFTTQSMRRLLQDHFRGGDIEVSAFGNVFAATAALHGLAAQEVEPERLDYHDPNYEVLVAARVRKVPDGRNW
jgi:SAM-dependent methyltransferase